MQMEMRPPGSSPTPPLSEKPASVHPMNPPARRGRPQLRPPPAPPALSGLPQTSSRPILCPRTPPAPRRRTRAASPRRADPSRSRPPPAPFPEREQEAKKHRPGDQLTRPVPARISQYPRARIKKHRTREPFARNPQSPPLPSPDAAPEREKIPRPLPHPPGPSPAATAEFGIPARAAWAWPRPKGGKNGRSDLIAARSRTCRRCLCFGRYHYMRCVRHREDPCRIFRQVFSRGGEGGRPEPRPAGRRSIRKEFSVFLTAAPQPAYLDAHV